MMRCRSNPSVGARAVRSLRAQLSAPACARNRRRRHESAALSWAWPLRCGDACRSSFQHSDDLRFLSQCGRRGRPDCARDFGRLAWDAAKRLGASAVAGCISLGRVQGVAWAVARDAVAYASRDLIALRRLSRLLLRAVVPSRVVRVLARRMLASLSAEASLDVGRGSVCRRPCFLASVVLRSGALARRCCGVVRIMRAPGTWGLVRWGRATSKPWRAR